MNLNKFPTIHDKENAFIDEALNPKVTMNNYELTTDEFNTQYLRYRLRIDWKAFKKFSWVKQQLLCEKKDIILLNHETRNEKIIRLSKKMTLKNLNTGIDKFNKGIDSFMKVIEPTTKQKDLSIPDIKLPNFKEMNDLLGSNKKQSFKLHNEKELKKLLGR